MKFNDLHWHNSIIKQILIDRINPGITDTIRLDIDWYDSRSESLVFQDVYWANLNLSFGVIAPESILDAYIAEESDVDLVRLNLIWEGQPIPLVCYVIELNSTGGSIKVIAKSFELL